MKDNRTGFNGRRNGCKVGDIQSLPDWQAGSCAEVSLILMFNVGMLDKDQGNDKDKAEVWIGFRESILSSIWDLLILRKWISQWNRLLRDDEVRINIRESMKTWQFLWIVDNWFYLRGCKQNGLKWKMAASKGEEAELEGSQEHCHWKWTKRELLEAGWQAEVWHCWESMNETHSRAIRFCAWFGGGGVRVMM